MLGGVALKTKKVIVLPYTDEWQTNFVAIRDELAISLQGKYLAIEHVGSTSVKGLSAKPIIDIDIVIEDYKIFKDVKNKLETIGYHHEGDLGIKDREAFKYEGKEHLQKHHLYVCLKESAELRRHITFRDYLQDNAEAIKEYSIVKEEAAKLFPDDIEKYMQYKASCIENLYKKCGL